MTPYLIFCCILFSLLFAPVVLGEEPAEPVAKKEWNKIQAEKTLRAADELWLTASPKQAIARYEELLGNLPIMCEPFRTMVIMRLAQSQYAAGCNAEALETLQSLETFEYVPEHHALAAKELMTVIQTGKNPGHARTLIPALPKTSVTIDVSPTGRITNLASAMVEARNSKAAGKSVEVVLETGTYRQNGTLALDEKDSGLVIRSKDPNNPAVITGGVNLKDWEQVTDPEIIKKLPKAVRDYVRVCHLTAHGIDDLGELVFGGFSSQRAAGKDARFRTFPIPELFYKGEPQTMARWPNDKLTVLPINSAPENIDPRFSRWAKEEDLWLYGYWHWDWADAYEKVAGIDEAGKISLSPPTNSYGFRRNMGCAVNALCELDQEGEWHLDTKRNLIHYLPPKDFDAKQCFLSSFGTIIAADNCSDLQIRDLKMEYVRGDVMTFKNCSRLLVAGVDIQDCSGLGIKVHGGEKHLIHSCRINSMGRGGIDFKGGDWQKLIPCNSIIENCRISDLSRIDRTYTPALLLEGMGIKVRNNAFVKIPSSAIRVEACDTLIELNHFQHCVYESGDQGAIDMWANPLYRGNIIRWNDFEQIINQTGAHYGAAAVRHDDYISGFMVSENVFRKGSKHGFGAVQFNQGTDNYVEGNIFIDWHKAFSGRTVGGTAWKQSILNHRNSKRRLTETDWQSNAWQKKYPMVRDLFNGDDNHNYLVDNQRLGYGSWGSVSRAISFGNRDGSNDAHGETLKSAKSVVTPWHPIPVNLIGPYDPLVETNNQGQQGNSRDNK